MPRDYRWSQEDLDRYLSKLKSRLPAAGVDMELALGRPADTPGPVRPRKYKNEQTVIGSRSFDSKKEAARFVELELLEKVGAIRDLECQPRYDLIACNGEVIGHFKPDFHYWSVELGRLVVEDVKSPITRQERAYRLRKRLFEACHGIILMEI